MAHLTSHEVVVMFLALGLLLATARLLGELFRAIDQPAVIGELLAGILLGPSILGKLAPGFTATVFPHAGPVAYALEGLTTVAVALLLLVAGVELDLSAVWRQGRTAVSVSLGGILFPFGLGFLIAWLAPRWLGHEGPHPFIFAMFFATALSISAMPVIAKTLLDLKLYQSDLGIVIMTAAIMNDLIGWMIFAVVLGLMGSTAGLSSSIMGTIGLTIGFTVLMLTVGRWIFHFLLPRVQAYASWPGGVLSFALSMALLGAAVSEWIGVHAIFGSFLVGIAIGDSSHLREQTRDIIRQFVSFIFAPLFFASVGVRTDFFAHFDSSLVLIVLAIACFCKIVGCGVGARMTGTPWRESLAIGFGMNSRGAMEIILGMAAMHYGLIGNRTFVALVVMALATSVISGPAMQWLLRRKKALRLMQCLPARHVVFGLAAADRREAIAELSRVLAPAAGMDAAHIEKAVWKREAIISTGLEGGVAIPHARVGNIHAPLVALGISREGVDFNAPDGAPSKIIFLILTPLKDAGAQLEILADVSRTLDSEAVVRKTLAISNYTELLALLRQERGEDHG
jgi:Kef-type K+ transport system membrane component KefB/mannitol/fructose-specific phosphotransferase system IIA component